MCVIGKLYKIDDVFLKCIKIRESGVNIFLLVDELGNHIVKYKGGLIVDYGIRIIKERTNELKEII